MGKEKSVFIFVLLIMNLSLINSADSKGTIIVNVVGEKCILDFKKGWNLFSFCKNLENTDLVEVLKPIEEKYRYVMRWNYTTQSFDIYSPRASVNSFTTFDDNESYFIYMYESAVLNVQGTEPSIEERNLIRGWNTPAYQYNFPTFIRRIISDVIENFRYLMKWDATNQEFKIYSKKSEKNPFGKIYPHEGRFIYMEAPDKIVY